jgi:hypothetical protein
MGVKGFCAFSEAMLVNIGCATARLMITGSGESTKERRTQEDIENRN